MKISIVVPTYNHLEDCLKPCLDSVIANTDMRNVELVVVANGCTDGTHDYVMGLSCGKKNGVVKLLKFDKPLGYTKATNEGIKAATGDRVVLLNNDVVLLPQEKNFWLNLCKSINNRTGL